MDRRLFLVALLLTGCADIDVLAGPSCPPGKAKRGACEPEPPPDPEPDPDPEPPPAGEWDRVLTAETLEGDVLVPDGQKWLVGPDVRLQGNLRTVAGTIAFRGAAT